MQNINVSSLINQNNTVTGDV